MKYTCTECDTSKPKEAFYLSKRNRRGLEYICKACKAIQSAVRRYNIPKTEVEQLYKHPSCMCCETDFKDKKLRHIHHVGDTIRGIVCLSCNHILGQESDVDQKRIQACLDFISRNNLSHTVNPQERPIGIDAVAESSETTCCETLHCKQCHRPNLTQADFHKTGKSRKPRRICRDCWNSAWRLRNKFSRLRKTTTTCQSCGIKFSKTNKSCVHHLGEDLRGIVCNRCNTVLGNESPERIQQLTKCLEFMI